MKIIIKYFFLGFAILPFFANALEVIPLDDELQKKLTSGYELQEKLLPMSKPTISCDEIKSQPIEKRVRSMEHVRCVFDDNGYHLNKIYQKALVENPTIEGTIIFKLVILPSGKVSPETSYSSELKNEKLENNLLNAVKSFDFFPVAESSSWYAKYPVNLYYN